jgi:hypothetical protein
MRENSYLHRFEPPSLESPAFFLRSADVWVTRDNFVKRARGWDDRQWPLYLDFKT